MDAQPPAARISPCCSARAAIPPDEIRTVLASLTQELGRPLTSLRAGLDLLLADRAHPIPLPQRHHVEALTTLCDELVRLTREYSDYADLVERTRPLALGTYTLGALVRELERQFARETAARQIRWKCSLVGDDVAVTTDASLCQQLLGKLVAQALSRRPAGGEIQLEAEHFGRHWRVTIQEGDTSEPAGTPQPDALAPESVREDLRLAVCRELVNQLAGELIVEGAPDRWHVVVSLPTVVGS